MERTTRNHILRAALVLLLAVTVLFGMVAAPQAEASGYQASFINKREDIQVDYTDYLNSSVMFPLADHIADDQEVSVIITVDTPDLLSMYEQTDKTQSFSEYAQTTDDVKAIASAVAQQKQQVLAKLDEQGIAYTEGDEYTTLLSGFELVIKAGDFDATCQSLTDGQGIIVSEEYETADAQLVENAVNVYTGTGIFNSSDSGYDGSGMVVAVLDTGLDSNHSAFSTENFTSNKLGMTREDVAAVLKNTEAYKLHGGLAVDDVYVNQKVPFAYDYADNDPDAYSTHNNHGTHVSGVIVGRDDTITGVAPNAQLVAMKIFSDVVDTARASWILSALEDCVVLGVDVINMSLGTACGFARESDEELTSGVYDRIREAGISVVVAASNSYSSAYGSDKNGNLGLTSNPDTATVGSPSTYKGTLSVASINGEETPYLLHGKTIIYFDESNTGAAEENDFCETLLGDADSKEYDYVIIPGVGRTADYTGVDVTGKIALVRRGDNTFEEKALIAEKQGAAGIIIYNNVSGEIKMNVGDAKLAVCSITQDDGEMLVAAGNGKLKISKDQSSGPFISEFSSWGPGPGLEIKPEITAHGGNILSSVTGGGYDRLSGTSMACPNLAGVVILLRQYVVENFPDIANDSVKVNEMVNKLMMSTADIANGTNGLPYAVRKQGAGLANLTSSLKTPAVITTFDKEGNPMDITKLELGDDPSKTGEYELHFTVDNFGEKRLTYKLGYYVMTEGVSDTKTNAGQNTVTEEAYILDGAKVEIVSVNGESHKGEKISVDAGESTDVVVKIILSDSDKAYLDTSFENGMYVEGYITLEATKNTDIDLSVPYLAFYGDWTQAPMFDLTYYDTNADELDTGIDEEDKTKADAYATRPIGGVEADYVSYLGGYYFLQDPEDMVIAANENYVALSNQVGTIHSLRFVWAGLLRSAQRVEIVITDDTTGEVVFETVDYDVRKSYGDGGSIYPANIEIEFDTTEYNLMNNAQLTVTLTGYMDYGEDGGIDTNKNNVFSFPLTIDFEAPTITDVKYYFEYDETMKKNRLYADVSIYDNHYSMATQLGYVLMSEDEEGNPTPELKAFEQFMTPVYSKFGTTTVVKYELTDYIYRLKEDTITKNTFVVTAYDYALNYATYEIGLPDDFTDFYFDGLEEGLTLSPYEVYSLEPLVYPETEWAELLEFTSSKTSVVRVVNNKLVAVASGKATVKVRDPKTNKSVTFPVSVLSEGDEGYRRYDKPVADVFQLTGYQTTKAYYQVDNEEKVLGDTGDTRFFEGRYNLEMYPSESVRLIHVLDAYFPKDTTVEYESSNESIVKIDPTGNVTAQAEGFASVTIKVMMDDKSTYYSETVSVEVKDPFITTGATLTHYFGLGGIVTIPEDLHLTTLGAFSFANFEYVEKTAEELAFDDAETSKQWYIGENSITKVVIPEGVEKIDAYCFANLTALEEVVLPSTLNAIEYGAFYGCVSLEKISFSSENKVQIISQNAFENCNLQGTLDLSAACVVSDYAFAGNKKLKEVVTGDDLLSIGQYAFAGCNALEKVTITAPKVKYGIYAFTDCESLTDFYVNAAVLPEGMFYECKGLKSVTVGPDVNEIGEFAFRDTAVETIEIQSGNTAYKVQKAAYVLSADGKTLVTVVPTVEGAFTAAQLDGAQVTVIGDGAFSHARKITSVSLPQVTVLGDYAFGSSEGITSVELGQLTEMGEYAFFETGITQVPAFTKDTVIGKYAFAYTAITSVTIPDGMTVEEGTFAQCKKLEAVVIGNDVTLKDYAFNLDIDEAYNVVSYDDEATGKRYFYYDLGSALKSLTIGDNAVIGERAFACHASLPSVTLGANAQIGKQAFYNCTGLTSIDLSKAATIGEYAFSGDEYYICTDENMSVAAVSTKGEYMTTDHACAITKVDLSSATSVGEYAFALCRSLREVVLGENITELPQYVFAGCKSLSSVNLEKVTSIGDYAFMESEKLASVDMSAATSIGEYAFVNGKALANVKFNAEGCDIGEGAFAYCAVLNAADLSAVKNIGEYAFAYTGLESANLSAAETIDTHAFIKEDLVPFKVQLGENLTTLGDNPFAMCKLEPFAQTESKTFNGADVSTKLYDYEISDTVKVVNGSLYCKTVNGWELITYASPQIVDYHVEDDTVRITSMAFAGSDVQRVTLPYSTTSIGNKAFYGCEDLTHVVFGSYQAPILEEEFDQAYYDCLEHLPGSGDYGTYTDYDGTEVTIEPMGMLPYFMWNATGGMYSNVYYGANFVDYVGYVDNKLTMVRPVNGTNYDSFVLGQYFDMTFDGAAAPDKTTVAAINAIRAIPERVTYEQRALVENARALYSKIGTLEQQSLVKNYSDLVSAEQRITALTPTDEPVEEPAPVDEKTNVGLIVLLAVLGVVLAGIAAVVVSVVLKAKKENRSVKEVFGALLTKLGDVAKKLAAVCVKVCKAVAALCVKGWKAAAAFVKKLFAKKPEAEPAGEEEIAPEVETEAEDATEQTAEEADETEQ